MKRNNIKSIFLLITVALSTLLSCSKPVEEPGSTPPNNAVPSNTTTLSKLQNTWIFESLDIYPTKDLSGTPYPGLKGNGIWNFRFSPNGKWYTIMMGSIDSFNYVLRSDSIILANHYDRGILLSKTDTAFIRTITSNSLVLAIRNIAGDYGKYTLRK